MDTGIRCKMCGAALGADPGSGYAVCEGCGSLITLPVLTDGRAERFREAYARLKEEDWLEAEEQFAALVSENERDPEGYWGMALCRYRIGYRWDGEKKEYDPVCLGGHQDAPFLSDPSCRSAIELSEGVPRRIYEKEAQKIQALLQPPAPSGSPRRAPQLWMDSEQRKRYPSLWRRLYRTMRAVLPLILGCVILLLLLFRVAMPAVKYRRANEAREAGDYALALSYYADLGEYKDAPALAAEAASALEETGTGSVPEGSGDS